MVQKFFVTVKNHNKLINLLELKSDSLKQILLSLNNLMSTFIFNYQ